MFKGYVPAEIKSQILKLAFDKSILLETLQNTACRLALVLCKEDIKTCLHIFLPRIIFQVNFAYPHPMNPGYHSKLRLNIKQFQLGNTNTIEFNKERFLDTEHWLPIKIFKEMKYIPRLKQQVTQYWVDKNSIHDHAPENHASEDEHHASEDEQLFGVHCVRVLHKLYPNLIFKFEFIDKKIPSLGYKPYIEVKCVGMKCNIPVVAIQE